MTEITISHIRQSIKDNSSIGDDLVLFSNFQEVPLSSEPKKMGCLFVALCLSGSAQYTIDTKEQMVHKNDMIVINENQVISDYMLSRDCNGVGMMLSQDFLSEIIKEVHEMSQLFLFTYTNPVFNLAEDKSKIFVDYFNIIRTKADESEHHFRKEICMSLLKAMLYDIGNEIYQIQTGGSKRTRAEIIFSDFIKLVQENFRHERRVSWYGLQMCITPKYLSESVKQVSRRTPNDWINKYLTLEIRVLLKNTNMTIKEIAEALNFPNQSFLGKYFKEHVGMSPTEYRRS